MRWLLRFVTGKETNMVGKNRIPGSGIGFDGFFGHCAAAAVKNTGGTPPVGPASRRTGLSRSTAPAPPGAGPARSSADPARQDNAQRVICAAIWRNPRNLRTFFMLHYSLPRAARNTRIPWPITLWTQSFLFVTFG
jgi:hypothetical protein